MNISYICGDSLTEDEIKLIQVRRLEYIKECYHGKIQYVTKQMGETIYYTSADSAGYLINLAEPEFSDGKHNCTPNKTITIYERNRGVNYEGISSYTFQQIMEDKYGGDLLSDCQIIGFYPVVGSIFVEGDKLLFTEIRVIGIDNMEKSSLWSDISFCKQLIYNGMKRNDLTLGIWKIKKINIDIYRKLLDKDPAFMWRFVSRKDRNLYKAIVAIRDKL